MQHDEVIWQVIRHNHCSYMSKIETKNFCRNPYNVTGICNRSSCPLANSRYATIREDNGVFYLYMKTIERAHMPNKLWERVKLPQNYNEALEVIDKHMMYWPKLLIHKIKQRLTKMTKTRIRMRKIALKNSEILIPIPRKQRKREARREEKAEKAAVLEKSIDEELLKRLKGKIYKDVDHEVINYPYEKFVKLVSEMAEPVEIEYVEGEEEYDDIEDLGLQFGNDDDPVGTDDEEEYNKEGHERKEEDSGLSYRKLAPRFRLEKKAKVLMEVEYEDGSKRRTNVH
ncbi:OLC1v1036781C1 [Oldenlandia corymbosa var. corymbosa]|uniref:Protein MAK16 homolog n=1 Tax=Oldenlandia corymbosa var. corymbosa TaxID=529605 RepID=A0AAV1CW43_OLDCO|nr:OLC1v1036781C1 [Oldenlandia corymbosa var. corymbosa]